MTIYITTSNVTCLKFIPSRKICAHSCEKKLDHSSRIGAKIPKISWNHLPSLKLTARPLKLMVGRWNFLLGMAYLQGLFVVSFREALLLWLLFFPSKQHRNQSIPQWIFVRNRQAALQGLRTHDAFPRLAWHHQRSSDGFRWARRTFETLGPRAGGGHIGLGVEAVEAVETIPESKGFPLGCVKGWWRPQTPKKGLPWYILLPKICFCYMFF